MERWIKGILAGSTAFVLAACGSDTTNPETETNDSAQVSSSVDSSEESSESTASSEVVIVDGVEMGPLLQDYMEKISQDHYYMKYQVDVTMGDEELSDMETTFAARDGLVATETVTELGRQNLVMDGDTTYMILHDQQVVYVMDMGSDEQEGEEIEEPIDMEGFNFVESGTRDGLDYETYQFESITTTYYFDKGELVRMDMDSAEMQSTMKIIEFSENPPAEMFEIPEDYERVDFGEGMEGLMEGSE